MSKPVLSVEALADWLRKQPGETTYNSIDACDCVVARFLKDGGATEISEYTLYKLPADIARVVFNDDTGAKGWTYAAALSRAEAILTTGRDA